MNPEVNGNLYLDSYPEILKNSWIQVTTFEDHPKIGYSIQVYKNTIHPSGTVIVSKYINSDYPDFYTTLDKDVSADRVYTNPIYRGMGTWKWIAVFLRLFFYNNMSGLVTKVPPKRNFMAHSAYIKAKEILMEKEMLPEEQLELFGETKFPRDPMYPSIWYNKRIKEVIKNGKN